MNDYAENIEQAQDWFLSHSSGELLCVKQDGSRKSCKSFPEAKDFFEG